MTTTADDPLSPADAGLLLDLTGARVAQLVRGGVLPARRTPKGRMILRRADVEALRREREQRHSGGAR